MLRCYLSIALLATIASLGDAQEIRNYDVNFTSTAPVIDGVVSDGEWDAASAEAGDWRELRLPFEDVDTDNNRFRILYDDANLYILYETDYDFGFFDVLEPDAERPQISFGFENLNLYIDPNNDGDLNTDADGNALEPGVSNGSNVDGYQIAFNQFLGSFDSGPGDLDGVGFYTEAHTGGPFGDQANWTRGDMGLTFGAGVFNSSGIRVAQNNTNTPDADGRTGIAEMVIPFADLNADAVRRTAAGDYNGDEVSDAADYTVWRDTLGDTVNPGEGADGNDDGVIDQLDYEIWAGANSNTGLNAEGGVTAGDVWGFNMSMITADNDNFLPIWNWHDNNSFAPWPHGTITFQGAAGVAVPEPSAVAVVLTGLLGAFARRR